jgi:hypothetical protein
VRSAFAGFLLFGLFSLFEPAFTCVKKSVNATSKNGLKRVHNVDSAFFYDRFTML